MGGRGMGGGGGGGGRGGVRLLTPKGQMSGTNMPPAITGLPASKYIPSYYPLTTTKHTHTP
jgi:hypothetical protein